MGGGAGKVGVAVDAVVQHQMPGQYLAIDPLAARPGAGNGLGRFGARHMHHINRHAQHIGNGNGAVGSLALHSRWARQRVAFRALDAHGGYLLLQQENQFAVLGVHGRHGAKLQRALEAVDQGLVVAHDGILVGHEVFEAVDAFLLHQGSHVFTHLLAPPGDGDVEGVIRR